MVSRPENSHDNSLSASFNEAPKQIAVLLSIDIALICGALASSDFNNNIGKVVQLSAIYLHIPIGIWIGIILAKSYPEKWIVAAYWFSVAVPLIALVAPYGFFPLRMFFPYGFVPAAIFIQWAILLGLLSRRFTRGRWPLPMAILFAICGVIFILINLSFETTEFGPLGMLFVNLFASPVFLLLPALIRIPACNAIKTRVARLQYVTYTFTAFFWIVFGIRVFSS